MKAVSINGDRLWDSVRSLGEIGDVGDGAMMRVTGSEADGRARDRVVEWFEDAGLDVRVDSVGNIAARRPGDRDLDPVVTGSHIDTVPHGGKFDGVAGVLTPLEAVRAWNETGLTTDRPVEIVVFTEEEGTRFGSGLLGSAVATGQIPMEDALAKTDDDGNSVADVLGDIGYSESADLGLEDAASFIELHVEQGPELEERGAAIGVVEHIAGISHTRVTFTGQANHAGTTSMALRRDAFMGAAAFALEVERPARAPAERTSTVGTVGRVDVVPNGTNVVPGEVNLGVDIRDTDNDALDSVLGVVRAASHDIADERDLSVEWESLLEVPATPMDETVVAQLVDSCGAAGVEYITLPSGAGHDAMNVATVAPTGMLFVPSEDGISHNPDEYTNQRDLVVGATVLEHALRSLADESS